MAKEYETITCALVMYWRRYRRRCCCCRRRYCRCHRCCCRYYFLAWSFVGVLLQPNICTTYIYLCMCIQIEYIYINIFSLFSLALIPEHWIPVPSGSFPLNFSLESIQTWTRPFHMFFFTRTINCQQYRIEKFGIPNLCVKGNYVDYEK